MKDKIVIKSAAEIELMREACRVTSLILDEVGAVVVPGKATEDINTFVHRRMLALGAVPATLNYKGYPKSVCTSVNEVICHGIPSPYVILKAGDIINVDVTCIVNGYHGDASRMFFVGGREACSLESQELVDHTLKALNTAIAVVRPKARFGDIGAAIMEYVNQTGKGYGIVREYTGHGLGRRFHEPPQVIHVGRKGTGDFMAPGMTFTIEPMINLGSHETVLSSLDGWTVRTVDNRLSAQWEHTVLVTPTGVEVLTASAQVGDKG